jgi:putative drug exporter of the RND superfamily
MFDLLGRWAAGHPWRIAALWLLVGVGLTLLAPAWDGRAHDDDVRFLPARCDSVRGYQLLGEAFPRDLCASQVVFAVERASGEGLTAADLDLVDAVASDLRRLADSDPDLGIKKVLSHRDPFIGRKLLSEDRRCTLIQVALGTPYQALQTKAAVDHAEEVAQARLREAGPGAPALYTTGPAGVGRDLLTAGGASLDRTTLATFLLVVVVLLLVYRSPLLALVPLATIAVAVWVALKVLALCTLLPGFYLVNVSQVFAVVMLYGAGTDYCLFLISRYREELARGLMRTRALARSVGGVGGALAASAGTVICGLGLMACAEFAKVKSGGPAIAVALAVALAASLTLTPALLRILGARAFWPRGLPAPVADDPAEGVWGRISRAVAARPLVFWAAGVALLAPLALVGLRVRPGYRATGELSRRCGSVRGLAAVQRHFTAGEVGPITVLLESSSDWNGPEGRRVVDRLTRGFGLLENVAEVRSLTQPLGRVIEELPPAPAPEPERPGRSLVGAFLRNVVQNVTDQVHRASRSFYTAKLPPAQGGRAPRYVTRLDVVLHSDPFDPASARTLELIQTWLHEELPGSTGGLGAVVSECYGVTVNARDLAEVTERDRRRVNLLVLGAVFLILLALVRRPAVAGYLLATVLLSYYATLGATTLAAHWVGGRPLGEVDWRVPFYLFTILVAVGEDYNILLVSRALEERRRHGAAEGTRRALARTGGTITSCGLIMAGTFATLMLAGLSTLVQVGFALAFGVLLDTFVVRPFLVPPFTLWAWRAEEARQPPRRLRRAA